MKKGIFFFAILFSQYAMGQVAYRKEFSKEIALHEAKTFVIKKILGESKEAVKFEVDPLVAASSGEITTLLYSCEGKKQSGLILGFFGDRWNDAGVRFQAYEFKNLSLSKAHELLDKIETVVEDNNKYLKKDADHNNIYFTFEDLTVLINAGEVAGQIRIYWEGFDSGWDYNEMKKTKKLLIRGTN